MDARGVEISGARVQRAIARGVSVYQGDIDQGLADYPDQAFDYVILSQTLRETRQPLHVLREMLRVGRRAIVAFPNFGHWRVRLSMLTTGRAQDAAFPVRLVRFAEHPLFDGGRFRATRAAGGAGDRAAVLSDGTPDGGHAAEFAGGSGGVSGAEVGQASWPVPSAWLLFPQPATARPAWEARGRRARRLKLQDRTGGRRRWS